MFEIYTKILLDSYLYMKHKRDLYRYKSGYRRSRRNSVSRILRIDKKPINHNLNEIRLFSIMRNESIRLPHFLDYYKRLGVNRFFLLDNNSTDNSVDLALSSDNVHVFSTLEEYQAHWYWMEHLLDSFGRGNWCVVVDIDELVSFPYYESLTIPFICKFLDKTKKTALRALLLDMYSTESLNKIEYCSGQNPLEVTPYFDAEHYEVTFPYFDRSRWEYFESVHFTGGMRERVFGKSLPVTSLNKFPLIKFDNNTYLGQGMHAVNGASISDLQGVVFHTKFLNDFIQEAEEESKREQHFNNAAYYKDFKNKIDQNPNLSLVGPNSILFKDSKQLIDLNLMKTSEHFDIYVQENK